MKSYIKLTVMAFLMAMLGTLSLNAQRVSLTGNNTNLRYGPSRNAGIYSDYYGNHIHYPRGTSFKYAGESRNGFYSIFVDGQKLWVSAQFANFNGARPQKAAPIRGKSLVINGTDVNFRLAPSINAGILSNSYGYHIHVPKYTRLPYLGASGNFFKTQYNGRIVYVSMQFSYVE